MERSVPVWLLVLCLILWLLLTVAFGWVVRSQTMGSDRTGAIGTAAVKIASFPPLVRDVALDLKGRITGDAFDKELQIMREPGADYSGFVPVEVAPGIGVEGLLIRADPARVRPGWRVLAGAFATADGVRNMALLMAPDLRVVHGWTVDEIAVGDRTPRPPNRKFLHGTELFPDGSLIFTFDGSISLQRFDSCNKRLWAIPGVYSHTVSPDDAGTSVWTIESSDNLQQVAVADGRVMREITVQDVIDANPMIDILELRRVHPNDHGTNSRNTAGRWQSDSLHLNDVEPLPAALAARFPQFAAGDLLISARSLNLVLVLDPETLEIKWWRVGAVQRQHDPDWMATGEIMVFNNRMSRDFSEIAAIDPKTMARRTLFDGRRNDFYSRIRGKAQRLDDGTLEITSAQQGRAFEVGPDGAVGLEIVNTKPGSKTQNYTLSDMRWLPADFFRPGTPCLPVAN